MTATITDVLSRLEGVKKSGKGWIARCPAHDDRSPSLSISEGDTKKIILHCHSGCTFDSIRRSLGLDFNEPKAASSLLEQGPKVVAKYEYKNAVGEVVYAVERLEPGRDGARKTFRQKRVINGEFVYGMDGVERVLYNLPDVLLADTVWVVEGEKCADALNALGYIATTNVGGAGKWLDGYSDSLKDRNVIICGDNDEPGRKHVKIVHESLVGKVTTLRIVRVPDPHNDIADFVKTFASNEAAKEAVETLKTKAILLNKGLDLPIYGMEQLEQNYVDFLAKHSDVALDFSTWLPGLKSYARPLVPGEVFVILAATGVGKTALLQNIALKAGLTTLLFELELPDTLCFERFVALDHGVSGEFVEKTYRNNRTIPWHNSSALKNIFVCPKGKITCEQIEEYILKSELIIGKRPSLVLIDYIQILSGFGSRTERVSDFAESIKQIAKTTGTIIGIASQVHRKEDDATGEVFLHDGKNSGSIENSGGLVIGAWRHPVEPNCMCLQIRKQTKGRSMREPIHCRIHDSLLIEEMKNVGSY